nr:hypothetical protein [Tanacetum cinerariifolium]
MIGKSVMRMISE